MTALREGNLEMRLPNGADGRKFDDATHALSHCMKAVDFVVELPDRFLFIEFKDPEHPSSPPANRERSKAEFLSAQLDDDQKYKYRDSFLYEWASGRVSKPVHYYVLVAISGLSKADLGRRTDALKSILPVGIPPVWQREIVAKCVVFNLDAWNRQLPQYAVARVGP